MEKLSLFKSCRTKSCGASDVEFFFYIPYMPVIRYPAFFAGTGWC